jgi:mannose-6-phosphate isomerase-like protein (cupin superfamily)
LNLNREHLLVYIKNWRDTSTGIAHLSAVHWGGLRHQSDGSDDDRNRLQRLDGFARHLLQGRKGSDYHNHDNLEQVYYVIAGSGEVKFDDRLHPVQAGDAVFLPPDIHHQMFNFASDDWLEHHVISMKVEPTEGTEREGQLVIKNWRDVIPTADSQGGMRWRQLSPTGDGETGCLRGMAAIDREAVQPGGRSAELCDEVIEHVYYGLEGRGLLCTDEERLEFSEGDMIHLPAGTSYWIENPHESWVAYLIMAG